MIGTMLLLILFFTPETFYMLAGSDAKWIVLACIVLQWIIRWHDNEQKRHTERRAE